MTKLSLEAAKVLIAAGERKAKEMGLSADIAIVDDGAHLIAFHRMDNARIAGIEISQNKAWTSVAMKMPTANLAQAAQAGGPSFGINTTNQGKIVILGGGIPLAWDGVIVGGVGVSGGSSAQDVEIANAVVLAFESMRGYGGPQIATVRIGSFNPYSEMGNY
ncbi:GlcG/HbpS family heme-binding protein [Paenibacillus mendelii]|uniref:Heme-binding protein n=1 Tax=Paenibacillus mendelii TaxID=206163 RepID=A0ABV6JF78_9BACL|nr:heme-binding protein [Paenibacillus mendelii]MCQ6557436.1 heme-binding protein [Paenibacillus mendelii]